MLRVRSSMMGTRDIFTWEDGRSDDGTDANGFGALTVGRARELLRSSAAADATILAVVARILFICRRQSTETQVCGG